MFLEFPANKDGYGDIIQLGDGSAAQTQLVAGARTRSSSIASTSTAIRCTGRSAASRSTPATVTVRNSLHQRHQGRRRGRAGDRRLERPGPVLDREQLSRGVGRSVPARRRRSRDPESGQRGRARSATTRCRGRWRGAIRSSPRPSGATAVRRRRLAGRRRLRLSRRGAPAGRGRGRPARRAVGGSRAASPGRRGHRHLDGRARARPSTAVYGRAPAGSTVLDGDRHVLHRHRRRRAQRHAAGGRHAAGRSRTSSN